MIAGSDTEPYKAPIKAPRLEKAVAARDAVPETAPVEHDVRYTPFKSRLRDDSDAVVDVKPNEKYISAEDKGHYSR